LSGWKARPTLKASFKPVWRQKHASFILMKLPGKEHAKAVNTNGSFRRVIDCESRSFINILSSGEAG
jgi:hypothetical protein